MGISVYLISTKGSRGCDRSPDDVYSFMAPDPFVEGRYCPTLDFVYAYCIMVKSNTLFPRKDPG
jgi:hypothetical protein